MRRSVLSANPSTALSTALVVSLLVACGADPSSGDAETSGQEHPLSSDVTDGVATFYDADGSGNCSFDRSDDLDVVALAMPEYGGSAACGACLRVTGPKGSVTVRVVDSCPPCAGSGINLDLSQSAFAKIADPKQGRVEVRYQQVACKSSGNLAFHFKDGSSKYWTAIQVRNHRVPIAKLEYQRGSSFVAMKRESYNYFVAEDGVGDQPKGLTLRVTSTDGQVIEETLPGTIPSDETVPGKRQFD